MLIEITSLSSKSDGNNCACSKSRNLTSEIKLQKFDFWIAKENINDIYNTFQLQKTEFNLFITPKNLHVNHPSTTQLDHNHPGSTSANYQYQY